MEIVLDLTIAISLFYKPVENGIFLIESFPSISFYENNHLTLDHFPADDVLLSLKTDIRRRAARAREIKCNMFCRYMPDQAVMVTLFCNILAGLAGFCIYPCPLWYCIPPGGKFLHQ